jgi:hypothetical protein
MTNAAREVASVISLSSNSEDSATVQVAIVMSRPNCRAVSDVRQWGCGAIVAARDVEAKKILERPDALFGKKRYED